MVTVVARPAGYPLTESYGRMFAPALLGDLYDLLRYLRYRVPYRGQWIIDVLRGDLTHRQVAAFTDDKVIRTLPAANRKAAGSR